VEDGDAQILHGVGLESPELGPACPIDLSRCEELKTTGWQNGNPAEEISSNVLDEPRTAHIL
jgi:hypothetical protein